MSRTGASPLIAFLAPSPFLSKTGASLSSE
jgi:hypothetical protein